MFMALSRHLALVDDQVIEVQPISRHGLRAGLVHGFPSSVLTNYQSDLCEFISILPMHVEQLMAMAENNFPIASNHKVSIRESIGLGIGFLKKGAFCTNFRTISGVTIKSKTIYRSTIRGIVALAKTFDICPGASSFPTMGQFMSEEDKVLFPEFAKARFIVDGRHQRYSGGAVDDLIGKFKYSYKLKAKGLDNNYFCTIDDQVVYLGPLKCASFGDLTLFEDDFNDCCSNLMYQASLNSIDELRILADKGYRNGNRHRVLLIRPEGSESPHFELLFNQNRIKIEQYFGRMWKTYRWVRNPVDFNRDTVFMMLKATCLLLNMMNLNSPLQSVSAAYRHTINELIDCIKLETNILRQRARQAQ